MRRSRPLGRGEMLWREKSAIPQDNILGALICADIYYPMSLLIYQSCGPKADQRPFWVRLPMPLPITSGHPEDDIVEQYAMNRLAAENLAAFEEHLLVCHWCQIRETEFDDFIPRLGAGVRSLQLNKPGLLRRPLMKNVFISHGGPSITHVRAVGDLLSVLGLTPVVSIDMPNQE